MTREPLTASLTTAVPLVWQGRVLFGRLTHLPAELTISLCV